MAADTRPVSESQGKAEQGKKKKPFVSMSNVLACLPLPCVCVCSIRMPASLMYMVGGAMEGMASLLSSVGVKFEPTFTKSRVQYLTTHHYYSIEKVRNALIASSHT